MNAPAEAGAACCSGWCDGTAAVHCLYDNLPEELDVAADDGGGCAGAAIASSKKLRLHGE
jgi:hypothetical protein